MNKKRISLVIPLGKDRPFDIKESIEKLKDSINPLVEIGPNPSKNRNVGIKKAKTEFIGFANSHSIIPKEWPKAVEDFFDNHPEIDIVGGPQLTSKNESKFVCASGYALASMFGGFGLTHRWTKRKIKFDADERHLTSANLICRNKVFKKVMFDENLWPGEDPKFISDCIKNGFKIAYSPEIYVYHKRRENFRELANQFMLYGKARNKKEPILLTLKKPSFLIPSLFVVYLLFLPLLLVFNLFLIIPFLIYILLNISFSFYQTIKNRDLKVIFIIPFIYFTIHFSYGLGFILEFFKTKYILLRRRFYIP